MITLGEHVSIFGITGSGKSTLTGQLAGAFPRRVIFDRLGEWNLYETPYVSDFRTFAHTYEQVYKNESFTIVFKPRPGLDHETLLHEINQVIALIYRVEAQEPRGVALIFEEVWLYAPLHSMPPWFQETLLTGRHHRISVIGNSQRPASVSKVFISQCRHVFVGQYFESRDRKYFEETFGRIPELDKPPEKFHFWWFRTAQKPVLVSTR